MPDLFGASTLTLDFKTLAKIASFVMTPGVGSAQQASAHFSSAIETALSFCNPDFAIESTGDNAMNNLTSKAWGRISTAAAGGVLAAIAIAAFYWQAPLMAWVGDTISSQSEPAGQKEQDHDSRDHNSHDHGGHGHDDPPHSSQLSKYAEEDVLELSKEARLNLGLNQASIATIKLQDYTRAIQVPAVIAAKPGRTEIIVSSPLSGVVTHVHAVTGEAVKPGDLLFEIRLTYEDLVETQTAYLRTISELAVENQEIARLEEATRSGALSGKSLLERRYEKNKLDALLRSQREALRLHGLSERQIDSIGEDGKLLRDLQVVAPDIDDHGEHEELRLSLRDKPSTHLVSTSARIGSRLYHDLPLVVEDLKVHKGQGVVAGEKLCSLSDYSQLFIEGKAFEQDIPAISKAVATHQSVTAVFPSAMTSLITTVDSASDTNSELLVPDLELAYMSNSIDNDSRTLSFFVDLPNQLVRDEPNARGQRFIAWQYRIGQRLELQIPVEKWTEQIVVPIEAVVKDAADWFVFKFVEDHFVRVPVHVQYRDQAQVVLSSDKSITPGDQIALRSAHQMQMALKNRSAPQADAHAGHTH